MRTRVITSLMTAFFLSISFDINASNQDELNRRYCQECHLSIALIMAFLKRQLLRLHLTLAAISMFRIPALLVGPLPLLIQPQLVFH